MPAQTGSLCFDATTEPKWDVPVATIGGLPIAVIDRARSAELMVDTAFTQLGALWLILIAAAFGLRLLAVSRVAR